MNIAIVNIYGDAYSEDKLFDINSCKIGQNLLLPGIVLKKELEKEEIIYIRQICMISRTLMLLFSGSAQKFEAVIDIIV